MIILGIIMIVAAIILNSWYFRGVDDPRYIMPINYSNIANYIVGIIFFALLIGGIVLIIKGCIE